MVKKKGISPAADSGESDPCTAFRSTFSARLLRIVPGLASFGLVAPMISRTRLIAFSPSRTTQATKSKSVSARRTVRVKQGDLTPGKIYTVEVIKGTKSTQEKFTTEGE